MFLLDSCILEYLRRPDSDNLKKKVVEWIKLRDESELHVSVISVVEKVKGAEKTRLDAERLPKKDPKTPAAKERMLKAANDLESQAVEMAKSFGARMLSLDAIAATHWGKWLPHSQKKGDLDLPIAAIAKAHGFGLVTANIPDFEERGILLINPLLPYDQKTGLNR